MAAAFTGRFGLSQVHEAFAHARTGAGAKTLVCIDEHPAGGTLPSD
jgi:hypothetical protein